MACRWLEGFESPDASATYYGRKYASGGGSSGTAGRVAGFCTTMNSKTYRTPSLGSDSTWTWGFAWNGPLVTPANIDGSWRFYLGASEQFRMRIQASSPSLLASISLMRGATVIATPVTNLTVTGWHYIELKVKIDTGTSGTIELRVDQVVVYSNSAVNTANAGVANADVMEVLGDSGQWRYDDIYINDSTTGDGLGNDTFRGDTQIVGFKPNGNGAIRQWTRSSGSNDYTLLADTSDSTYLSDGTVGHETVMDFEDPSIPSGTIFAIMLTSLASLDVAGTRQYSTESYLTGVSYPHPTSHVVGSTTIAGYVDVVEANPATATNWLASELNAAQFGLKVTV